VAGGFFAFLSETVARIVTAPCSYRVNRRTKQARRIYQSKKGNGKGKKRLTGSQHDDVFFSHGENMPGNRFLEKFLKYFLAI